MFSFIVKSTNTNFSERIEYQDAFWTGISSIGDCSCLRFVRFPFLIETEVL